MRIFLNKYSLQLNNLWAAILFFSCVKLASAQVGLIQDPNVLMWLDKMADAKANLNYTVSYVLTKPGADPQPYLWRHGVNEEGIEMEQLDQLNGPGREVVRMGEKVSYFESHRAPYSLASGYIIGPMPNVLLTKPKSLLSSYDFVIIGKSRISGKVAQQIRMISKDKSRYGYNLWLDQQTGLPLKINVMDLNGQKVEQIQVTALNVTEQPDPYFAKLQSATMPAVIQLVPTKDAEKLWQVDYIPVGMKQVKHSVRQLPDNAGSLEYLMLSDGLVDISIYMQQATASSAESDIVARFGSDIYFSRKQGAVLVTVIGKIPANTANSIATSVTRVQ
ncbi:MucB/RseB C-terminal domain-containing protein [Aliiglaciecola aliphaticivorans]